ncbi:histidinol-phosphatase HisJ family protein [Clostridiaceae bacterium NSJ-31]|uniref:Histidinol-phosphatase n=1 Tax=Ligaoa zhengdingensis TaxID=2763658 RepID=A0A926DZY6_9FIRM|nr:histidinol-phosphatase HisJ family protein [Ligaoa zhengdingensis]MBC8546285.1 histidinol-phosphatase HisJ family protein [Ligaoa zhengdingensis]
MLYNLFDSHTHSDNSFDGTHSIMFMCESAIARGLLGIAVTDHADIDFFEEQQFLRRLGQSYFEVQKARSAFGSGFALSSGIEIGEPDADPALADRALAAGKFDFVIGSVHSVWDKKDPYYMNFAGEDDPYAVLGAYFDRMQLLLDWGKFDVLGHLTYPMRYIARDGRDDVTLERFDGVIDEILRRVAHAGKGIEINTSGLRQPLGLTMPTLRYVRRYRELGGEIITIGSDAHRAEDLGAGIADGMELARAAGFRYFCFYKRREPRMLRLY